MAGTHHRRVILEMDSPESPVYGEQEGVAYNGHFEAVITRYSFKCRRFRGGILII